MTSLKESVAPFHKELTEVDKQLSDPNVISNPRKLKELGLRRNYLEEIIGIADQYFQAEKYFDELKEALDGDDVELAEMAELEMESAEKKYLVTKENLENALLPPNPDAHRNALLEIRAGTGGDEAGIWAGDLFNMYQRAATAEGFNVKVLNKSQAEMGGFKELVCQVKGRGSYGFFASESGIHRVQRVPQTESQGRLHTSAASVYVLPEADSDVNINIDLKDLAIDTYRASGAGGQHVNKTDSAVRITHMPTGIVVQCQDGRSQHQNKETCLNMLKTKLYRLEIEKQEAEGAQKRKSAVGKGDRSEKIRTYNYPQNRVTDHRVSITNHQLSSLMMGEVPGFFKQVNTALRRMDLEEI
ncbi:peptide chain release factor 1 [bacterium]|nr:peptide chain release factor 1 [bacterium]|tara:strand:- start:43000 stop:44073 length:1074 start_codon:yes stop_codon:yes gene_type:complete